MGLAGPDTSASGPAKRRNGKGQSTLDGFPKLKSQKTSDGLIQTPCLTLKYSVGDSLARLSLTLERGKDSLTPGVISALRSLGLLDRNGHVIYFLRTSQAYFHTPKAGRLRPSSLRWMPQGTMRNGRCFTARIGYRRTARVSSLLDILEDPDKVPRKYFLSETAKRRLLSREIEKRVRKLGSAARIMSQL